MRGPDHQEWCRSGSFCRDIWHDRIGRRSWWPWWAAAETQACDSVVRASCWRVCYSASQKRRISHSWHPTSPITMQPCKCSASQNQHTYNELVIIENSIIVGIVPLSLLLPRFLPRYNRNAMATVDRVKNRRVVCCERFRCGCNGGQVRRGSRIYNLASYHHNTAVQAHCTSVPL